MALERTPFTLNSEDATHEPLIPNPFDITNMGYMVNYIEHVPFSQNRGLMDNCIEPIPFAEFEEPLMMAHDDACALNSPPPPAQEQEFIQTHNEELTLTSPSAPRAYNTTEIDMPDLDFDLIFRDPIMFTVPIDDPRITPDGNTYDKSTLDTLESHRAEKNRLNKNPKTWEKLKDPMTRREIILKETWVNELYSELKNVFYTKDNKLKTKLNLVELKKALTCPLSGQVFKNPVVDALGHTYEYDNLLSHLRGHNYYVPDNHLVQMVKIKLSDENKNAKLNYENRTVTNLYDELKTADMSIEKLLLNNPAVSNQGALRAGFTPAQEKAFFLAHNEACALNKLLALGKEEDYIPAYNKALTKANLIDPKQKEYYIHVLNEVLGLEIDMPNLDFDLIFNDPIMFTMPINPHITPSGYTYDKSTLDTLESHLAEKNKSNRNPKTWEKLRDPMTRDPLVVNETWVNELYSELKNVFYTKDNKLKTKLNLVELKKVLTCPLSGQLFKNPAVDALGHSYEYDNLLSYLREHNYYVPGSYLVKNLVQMIGIKLSDENKDAELNYINRTVTGLYDELKKADMSIEKLLLSNPIVSNQGPNEKFIKRLGLTEKVPNPMRYDTAEVPMPRLNFYQIFGDYLKHEDTIAQPYITPNGRTFHHETLMYYIKNKLKIPVETLTHAQVLSNELYSVLKNVFYTKDNKLKTTLNLIELRKALTCPLSGQLFEDPVVDDKGITYEAKYLLAYLRSHNYKVPGNKKNSVHMIRAKENDTNKDVKLRYHNHIVTDLYYELKRANMRIEVLLLNNPAVTNQENFNQNRPEIEKVGNYVINRAKEPEYTGYFFGSNREQKVTTGLEMIKDLHHSCYIQSITKVQKPPFFNPAKEGKLRTLSHEARHNLITQNNQNNNGENTTLSFRNK